MAVAGLHGLFFAPTKVGRRGVRGLAVSGCHRRSRGLTHRNNLSLIILKLNTSNRFYNGLPGAARFRRRAIRFPVRKRVISVITRNRLNNSFSLIPSDCIAVKPGDVVTTGGLLVVIDNTNGTRTLGGILRNPIARSIPTSILRLRPSLVMVTSGTTTTRLTLNWTRRVEPSM